MDIGIQEYSLKCSKRYCIIFLNKSLRLVYKSIAKRLPAFLNVSVDFREYPCSRLNDGLALF